MFAIPYCSKTSRVGVGKREKLNQDLRVDMPTIGPETIRQVYDAKLASIISPGKVIVLDQDECFRLWKSFHYHLSLRSGKMKVYLVAGEPSGDKLEPIMAGLKAASYELEFCGVGGPLTEEQGLTSLFPITEKWKQVSAKFWPNTVF